GLSSPSLPEPPMPSLSHRPYPYLALSLAVTACTDDLRPEDSVGDTVASMSTSLGGPTVGSTGGTQTGEPTTTEGGMSATMGGTGSTAGTVTDPTSNNTGES